MMPDERVQQVRGFRPCDDCREEFTRLWQVIQEKTLKAQRWYERARKAEGKQSNYITEMLTQMAELSAENRELRRELGREIPEDYAFHEAMQTAQED